MQKPHPARACKNEAGLLDLTADDIDSYTCRHVHGCCTARAHLFLGDVSALLRVQHLQHHLVVTAAAGRAPAPAVSAAGQGAAAARAGAPAARRGGPAAWGCASRGGPRGLASERAHGRRSTADPLPSIHRSQRASRTSCHN